MQHKSGYCRVCVGDISAKNELFGWSLEWNIMEMAMFAWDPCGVELAHSLCLSPTSEQGSYRGMLSKLFLIKHEECPAAKQTAIENPTS